ncbi:MAG: holo-ACP synthase [Actinobacteria bacterium]|nr:holo-ACP synthase [Actinomycetota bacterium]
MVLGIGVDVAEIERFTAALERVPRLRDRLFTPAERGLPPQSLAARFAAKEAVAKALGSPGGMSWQDCEVVTDPSGAPRLRVTGSVARVAAERGITTWHLSLSHDGGTAIAMVVAE